MHFLPEWLGDSETLLLDLEPVHYFGRGLKQWAVDHEELSNTISLTPYLILGWMQTITRELLLFDRQALFIRVCNLCNISPRIKDFSLFLSHYTIQRKQFLNLHHTSKTMQIALLFRHSFNDFQCLYFFFSSVFSSLWYISTLRHCWCVVNYTNR